MSRLPLALVLLVGVVVGAWLYIGKEDPASEATTFGLLSAVDASDTGEDESAGGASAELRTPEETAQPESETRALVPSEVSGAETGEELTGEVDELADWTGPWPKYVEEARRTFLDRSSSLDEKGSALKALQVLSSDDHEDPRSEEVLMEAAWILAHTDDAGVLDDVLDGIEDIQHDALIEPVIGCLINHESAKVRSGAVNVLKSYEDSERAKVALEHAAQYDEDERVRRKAGEPE